MKVLLYYAKMDTGDEYMKYPLGLLYLAAAIKKEHKVIFYDSKIDDEPIENVISDFNPDIIGVSFTTGSKNNAFSLVKKFPDRFFIAGGFHPTVRPKECLENGFDAVLSGEGEITFPEILRQMENGAEIKGIYYGIKPKNLDELAFPAREIIPKKYFKKYDQAAIACSRGCVFNCSFCGSARSGLRKRSPKNIVDELEDVVKYHKNQPIHFSDDSFTTDSIWVNEIANEIEKRGLKIKYSINSRVDIKDYDVFESLKKSGCEVVAFGIESGSEEILKKSNKPINIGQVENTVIAAKKAGLMTRTNWIVGLPGNYKEQMKSLDLMKKIRPDQVHIGLFVPYPGSLYGDNPEKYGIHLNADWTSILSNIFLGSDFQKGIIYDYLSSSEIIDVVMKIKTEMKKLGYDLPGNSKDKMIRTFLDEKLMDFHKSQLK